MDYLLSVNDSLIIVIVQVSLDLRCSVIKNILNVDFVL